MMKRLISIFIAIFFLCTSTWADEEYNITLEKGSVDSKTIVLPYGIITFRLVEDGNDHRVTVSFENTTESQAILLFKNSQDEKVLKKNKPKIEFVKTYPGDKGKRMVLGCEVLNQPFLSIIPEDKLDLFRIDVSKPKTSINKLVLPIYLAEYDANQWSKKGTYNINYKILRGEIVAFNIEIKLWSENAPEYVAIKGAVEDYLQSIKSVTFCKNERHTPPLEQQMKPYQEKMDSLINVINTTLQDHREWHSTDEPHIKYSELLTQLNEVNLNDHIYDCGEHKSPPVQRSCGYCSLSAQQIYHQLDDLYQQLRNGKIDKNDAVKKAQGLYTCYQEHAGRKKDSTYSKKISQFYNRIVNY